MLPGNVIDLSAARARRQPHEAGVVTCASCGCETVQARPVGAAGAETQCPVCGSTRARFEPMGFVEIPPIQIRSR
jgi:rubrerythrin